MTEDEFELYLQAAVDELAAKQKRLQLEFGLGVHPRWDYDGRTGLLSFTGADGVPAIDAQTIQIGSFSPDTKTFLWSWANDSVPEAERTKSARMQGLADLTGIDLFRSEGAELDEEMAPQLIALCVRYLNALGVYRTPTDSLQVFLAITDVKQRPAE